MFHKHLKFKVFVPQIFFNSVGVMYMHVNCSMFDPQKAYLLHVNKNNYYCLNHLFDCLHNLRQETNTL